MVVRVGNLVACLAILLHQISAEVVAQQITPRLPAGELKQLRLPDVRITSAVHRDASLVGRRTSGAHVEVDGVIGGQIQVGLLLPDSWNSRLVMGEFPNQARQTMNQGYATVGTDGGRGFGEVAKAGWGQSLEDQVNLAYLAVHRAAEVAKAIIHAYYGSEPKFSYFSGCSWVGGQALIEAQRCPEDFDGIVAAAPIVNATRLSAARVYESQQFFPDPSKLEQTVVTEELLRQLHAEVIRKCDEQDGVKDGLLDDPRQCRFDLSEFEGLTPTQRNALQAVYDGLKNENGPIYPGMPLGSELGWYRAKVGSFPSLLATQKAPNLGFLRGIETFKLFIFHDMAWDYSKYDFSTWEKDSRLANALLRADNPDLSKFKNKGGKLIIWHGWSDGPVTPLSSIKYFDEVEKRDAQVRDYFRLFLLPGVDHCGGGAGPDRVDWLDVIRRWVEHGDAPHRLIASKRDRNGNVTMTRPIYPYPLRAIYSGRGSTNEAESFVLPGEGEKQN